jgi:endonuclease YncB( thermonuclease family)
MQVAKNKFILYITSMKNLLVIIVALFSFLLLTPNVDAHPGRTDSSGGHNCRVGACAGTYHYHNGGSAPVVQAPVEQAPVYVAPTSTYIAPTRKPYIAPTKTPTPTKVPYKETAQDKLKLFKVVSIVDGDTIKVNVRGNIESVRLLGIDTPETVDPRKPVQCFGKEASNKMNSLVAGKFVKLIDDRSQGQRDKYKRLLRYAYVDKVFINKEMVAQGYATSYKQYPTKYLNEFNKLEVNAREKQLGLWKACK